jgi:HlyD family secretion protein
MKRVVLIIVAILVVGGGIFIYLNISNLSTAQSAEPVVDTSPLVRGNIDATISAIGKIRPGQTASLYWKTSGTVETVSVKVGDLVKTGDVLARLEQTSLPQNVILAQADLLTAQQALDDLTTQAETSKVQALQDISTYEVQVRDAQYQLDNFTIPTNLEGLSITDALLQTKASLEKARQAFEPYKFLAENNSTREKLKDELGRAQSDYNTVVKWLQYDYTLEVAQANLQQAWDNFNKWKNGPTEADVETARAKIAAAQATLEQAWVEAPFDGTITQAIPNPGDQVTSTQLAFRIDDLNNLYVDLNVSEVDISQIHAGQEATIRVDALRNKIYHGTVDLVGIVSGESTSVVDFPVTIKITDADSNLRPGMTSEVSISVSHKENVLLIPLQAVQLLNGKQVVYVLKPGEGVVPVEVTLGISSDTQAELVGNNLKEGDLIVLGSAGTATQGQGSPGFFFFRRGGPSGGTRNNNPNQSPPGDNVQRAPGG